LIPVLWAHVPFKAIYYTKFDIFARERPVYRTLVETMLERPNFYNAIIMTILIFHPWFFVRKRKVDQNSPQKNLVILDGFTGRATAGHWGRIALTW
jgi:hypothetical protein